MQPADAASLDLRALNKLLDQTKAQVFMHSGTAAFLGSIMSSLEFTWTREIPTAATDGIHLWWNPDWFLTLTPKNREVVLRHELWHVARLHMIRQGTRDPHIWNLACDYVINNDLVKEQCDFSFGGLVNPAYADMPEEDIYDELAKQPPPPDFGAWKAGAGPDMYPLSQKDKQKVVNTVVTAVQQAKMSGAGNVPGGVTELIEQFLTPVVPWQSILSRWCTQLLDEDYSWARPNRRYDDMYLPSRRLDMGRLENLAWYMDVSGSCKMTDCVRFKSELKFVKDTFRPEKLTVVQFDTAIRRTDVWEEDDEFDKLEIFGRGGTSLACVHRHILEEKPTAAIIFSDMECAPMSQEGIEDIPVLWVMLPSRRGHKPTFGESLTIQDVT
jgi:predicted metal-dependent peptidase